MKNQTALQMLIRGNERFVSGKSRHPNQSVERRREIAAGQKPFAAILCCSDSRCSPELIFDQGLGDLFVLRVAGNAVNDMTLGSLEYAVDHLGVGLIVVLGHKRCGAVQAAVQGGVVPGHIPLLVEAIQPAVDRAKDLPGDRVDNAAREHVRRETRRLGESEPILAEQMKQGQLTLVGAFYDLDTGVVEILE